MANILKRTSDHIFYGTKTKNNRPVIGGYVTIYNTTTAAFFGQTQTDTNGNWTVTVSNPTPTPGVYEVRFYGSGLRAALPPDGDWETLTVTSEGLDALNVVLSIYTSSVTCENDGTVIAGQLGSTGTTQTHVNAYYGVTSLTATNTVPSVGQYTISGIVTSGLSAAINTSTNQDVYVTAFPAANNYGYVDISVYANPIGSGIISTTKRFTVSKSRKGNDGSSGIIGPSLVYTGTWDSGRSYVATSGLVEAVKASDNNYYYARANSLNQNPTSSPTYWTYFSNQFASVATDLLLAQDVAVGRGITLGTSTPDGGSTGVLKTANASSLYVGSGAYLAANAGGTGLFRVGLVAGGILTRGIAWDGDTSTFTIKAANFTLDSSGNITAEGGTVGGWTISSAALYKNTGTDATSAGMAPGDYPFYAGKQYASRATAPFRVTPAGAMTATSGSIGGWTIGTTSLTGGSNPGIGLVVGLNTDTSLGYPVIYAGDGDPSSAPFQVFEDGSMVASNATITGNITATGGRIGQWFINDLYLGTGANMNIYNGADGTARIEVGTGSNVAVMRSVTGGSDYAFYAGNSTAASAPFRVTAGGSLFATNATISGVVTAGSGSVGGWTISSSALYKDTGVDATSAGMAHGDFPFYAGKQYTSRSTAPFRVTNAGSMTATSGSIGGWTIDDESIFDPLGNIVLQATGIAPSAGILLDGPNTLLQIGSTIYMHGTTGLIEIGSNLTLDGAGVGTITGGTIQTSSGSKKITLTSVTNELTFDEGGSTVLTIGSDVESLGMPGIYAPTGLISARYLRAQYNASGAISVYGKSKASISSDTYGVWGEVQTLGGTAVNAIGVYGTAYGLGSAIKWAGYFDQGNVGIVNYLNVSAAGDNTAAGYGIYFGSSRDTNLYRSAANTLKTDDTFNAAAFQIAGTDINTAGTLSNVAYENQANSFNSTQTINTGNGSDELELGQKAYPGIINFVTEGTSGGTIYTRLTSTSPSANDSSKTIYLPDSSGTLALVGIDNSFSTTQTITGDLHATGEVISYYSDSRLKDNVQPLTKALDRLLAVRGVEFDWSKDTVSSRQFKHDVGVIAQEVMKVLPEAVTEPWSATRVGPKYHSVLYEKLIPLIIEAIRELKEEIDGK